MILHERDLFDLSTVDPDFHDLTVPGSFYLPLMLAIRREDRQTARVGPDPRFPWCPSRWRPSTARRRTGR